MLSALDYLGDHTHEGDSYQILLSSTNVPLFWISSYWSPIFFHNPFTDLRLKFRIMLIFPSIPSGDTTAGDHILPSVIAINETCVGVVSSSRVYAHLFFFKPHISIIFEKQTNNSWKFVAL